MGVSETTKKLAYLRAKFPKAREDFENNKSCYMALNPAQGHETLSPEQQFAVIIDGSVYLEPAIEMSTPSVVVKDRAKNEDPALRVAKNIFCSLERELLDSAGASVSTVVFLLGDTHERPEIKEDRGYAEESSTDIFTTFPISKKKMIEEHAEAIRRKYVARMEAHASPKRSMKKKVGEESEEEEEENEGMSAHDKHKTELMNEAIAEFRQHKFDSWAEGKSLPQNRFMVYRALTKHIVALTQNSLRKNVFLQEKCIILDNVVLDEDKYTTLRITVDSVDEEKTNHHGICECEQAVIYWVHRLMSTEKKSRFLITTTDTDIFGCVTMNWETIVATSPESIDERMILLKAPNKDTKSKELKKLYSVIDFYKMFSGIPIAEVKEWGFLTFIALGCDFVNKLEMHGLLQKTKTGLHGDDRTNKLLEILYSGRHKAKKPLTTFTQRPDGRYTNGLEWQINLDIPAFFVLMAIYRKEDKSENFTGFSKDVTDQLTYHLKTAVYAGEYFLNQWRLKNNAGKLFRDPASNPIKYGHTRGQGGKLVVMETLKEKKKRAKGIDPKAKKARGKKKWSEGDDGSAKKAKTKKPAAVKKTSSLAKKKATKKKE